MRYLYFHVFKSFNIRFVKYLVTYLNNVLALYIKGFLMKFLSLFIFISKSDLFFISLFFKYNYILRLNAFTDLVVIDYINRPNSRFELTYCFLSIFTGARVFIKFGLKPMSNVISLVSLFNSAAWLEREAWDLYGIKFFCHPNLRRILTDYGFWGHPFRKDFPLIGFNELRYDDSLRSVVVEPVESSQGFRFYTFENPWVIWH